MINLHLGLHLCPEEIVELFDNEMTIENGRERASRWAGALKLEPGDIVWMPELGWLVRCDESGNGQLPTFH